VNQEMGQSLFFAFGHISKWIENDRDNKKVECPKQ
jgi:hypothetical protein